MIRCTICSKTVDKIDSKWQHWQRLCDFLEFQYNQGEITEMSYETLFNSLLRFKEYAMDEDEKNRL